MTDFPAIVVRDSESLAEAFAAIKNHLNLSAEACEQIGGLTKGHIDKYLGPSGSKRIGPVTFDIFCELFAVEFVMRPNPAALQRMAARFEERQAQQVRRPARVSKTLLDRALRHLCRELSWPEILAAIGEARAAVAAEAKAERNKAELERYGGVPCRTAPIGAGRDRRVSKPESLRYGGQQTARARIKAMQGAYLTRAKAAAAPQI